MKDNFISSDNEKIWDNLWREIFLSPSDASRFAEILSLLSMHLADPAIVTGSFAVEWQLRKNNGEARQRRLNDIDLVVAKGMEGIDSYLRTEFLIHHFHPTREAGNVLIQLVEPRTQTRVDIFSPRSPSIRERTSKANIDGINCEVLATEDLAARLLAIVGNVMDGVSADPKYLDSLLRVVKIADPDLTRSLWNSYRRGSDSADFDELLDAVTIEVRERPDLLKPTQYSQDIAAECPFCIESKDFPIAKKSQIFEILGYV